MIGLAKICTNCYGHMTKMATKLIYGKNDLNIFFSRTKMLMALGLLCNVIPNAFIMGKS